MEEMTREELQEAWADALDRIAELEEEKVCLLTDTPLNERLLTQRRTIGKQADRIAELEATIKRVKAEVRNIDETFSHPDTTSREAYQNIRSIVECLHKALGEAK